MSDFVSELLEQYKIIKYRELFTTKQYSKENMSKQFDELVKPFVLTEEQQKLKSGIFEISQLTIQNRIQSFSFENDIFIIQPIKVANNLTAPLLDFQLPYDHLLHGNNNRKRGSTTSDRKRKQDSVVVVGNDDNTKKKTKAGGKKKTGKDEIPQYHLPHILQPILQTIFDEFWGMEIEPILAIPFYSTITRDNCVHFGMADFYEKVDVECTFANIKEKLSHSLYTHPDQFEHDFNLMIKNITTYYPPNSPHHNLALEFKRLFDTRWREAFQKFI